jgi:capsular exopolysaccharide synthesis family protein
MDLEQLDNSQMNETIDIKSYISNIIRIWYFFPISLLICFSIGYYMNIKTVRKFKATSTILIKKDAKPGNNSDELTKGFGLFDNQQNIENEIGIIKSYMIAENTIKSSNHFVSYYKQNKLRRDNIYSKAPFVVYIDNSHPQLIGLYKIKYLNNNTLKIELEQNNNLVYDFILFNSINTIKGEKKLSKTVKLGEWIETPWLRLKIEDRIEVGTNTLQSDKESYYFQLRDLKSLSTLLNESIKAEPTSKKSDILDISMIYDNADEAVDFLNEFIEQYTINNLKEKNKIASSTIEFIDMQLSGLSDSLHSNEYQLESFRQNNKVINIDVQVAGAYEQSQKIATDIALAELRLKYFKYLSDYIQNKEEYKDIVTPSVMGISDALLNKLVSDLFNLSTEKNKLLFNTTTSNPLVININKQIAVTKNAIFETIKSLNSATLIEIAELKRNLKVYDKELLKIPETERSLIGIQRNFKINNDIYIFLLQKRAESAIAKASNMPDSQLIDSARAITTNPISPNKQTIYLLSLIIGLILPIIYVIVKKNLYDYIESKSDITPITQIPIISNIPHSEYPNATVVNDFPKSDIAESFRGLRTKLKFVLDKGSNNIILVTSSVPAEGKTFSAVNIAIGYAITNKRTIILGLDLRNPGLSKVFDADSHFGVSTYLSEQSTLAESISKTHIENLDYLSAGPIPPNPSELIGTEKMVQLIDELKKQYEYVIIDSPPINIVSDAIQLFPHVNAILYIVRLNYTRKRFLEDINYLYLTKQAKNIGIIINDDTRRDSYEYRYRYGYKYRYSYYYSDNINNKNKKKILSLFRKNKM